MRATLTRSVMGRRWRDLRRRWLLARHPRYRRDRRFDTRIEGVELTFSLEEERARRWFLPRYHATRVHEPEVSRHLLMAVREAECFVDVGAHLGWFTCLAARAMGEGRVYSFEIDEQLVAMLRRNAALNGGAVVEALPLAVSDLSGPIRVRRHAARAYAHSVIAPVGAVSAEDEYRTAEAVALDDFFADRTPPDLVKIDVEGAELRVLRGMHKLLERARPLLFVEIHPAMLADLGDSAGEVVRYLHDHSYDLSPIAQRRVAGSPGEPVPLPPDASIPINTMIHAIPRAPGAGRG